MINLKHTFVFFGLILNAATHANSDQKLDQFLSMSLEELMALEVTISTDTKQTIAKAPAAVTVLTSEDIKATGSTNLVEILESVPGIHVRASQFAFRPLVQFRGASASQTLLMVNGTPMRDLMWGFGIFWKGIPTSIIDRVEIIRGPGSALFGADASAGVINVITKTAGKIDHSEVGVRNGSFDSKTGWMQYGDNWNGFDVSVTLELYSTNGHHPYIQSDGQTQQDNELNTTASFAPGTAQFGWNNTDFRSSIAKDNWRVHIDYARHHDLETGISGAGILDPATQANDNRFNIDLFYSKEDLSDKWGIDAELRYQDLEYSSGDGFQEYPPGAFNGDFPNGVINKMRSAERRFAFETSGLYSGFDDHSLRLGLGYTLQNPYFVRHIINKGIGPDGNELPPGSQLVDVSDTPYAFAPKKTRIIRHLFFQDVWSIDEAWELTAGVRYDNYSDFGDTFNPRLALFWQSTDRLTTKLMFGRAFRPPSYLELFTETSFALPNPNLKPERSETLELIFTYLLNKDLNFGLNLYHFKQSDFIRQIPVLGLIKNQQQNIGEHTIRGIEIEARWQATEDLRISANYTFRNPDNNNFRTVVEPDQDAYLRADWHLLPDWNWNVQSNWIGKRTRSSNDTRPSVDEYFITDTTARYTGLKDWEIAISIRNLFDKDAREYTSSSTPDDLPLAERNLYAEFRYNFSDNIRK
ncbi:MAG: TonB-dependent receptor [Candidatus Thiodiazotropha sp. (ex Lucinoma borealis)]|nr:TonB-dependent receptor [Candidatus Thiodiazotropha sp. (ex Lucinoma borealis)]